MTNISNTNNWKGGTDAPENCKHTDNGSIDVNLYNNHSNVRCTYLVLPVYVSYIIEYSVSVSYLRSILYLTLIIQLRSQCQLLLFVNVNCDREVCNAA